MSENGIITVSSSDSRHILRVRVNSIEILYEVNEAAGIFFIGLDQVNFDAGIAWRFKE